MSIDQLGGLITALALLLTAIGGLVAAITALVKSLRRTDDKPPPEVGIPAPPVHDEHDIDYRAYLDMKARAERAETDRDAWMKRALGIDEDTQPLDPT